MQATKAKRGKGSGGASFGQPRHEWAEGTCLICHAWGAYAGTGFLMANNLIMAPAHLFRTYQEVKDAKALFLFQVNPYANVTTSIAAQLVPDEFFLQGTVALRNNKGGEDDQPELTPIDPKENILLAKNASRKQPDPGSLSYVVVKIRYLPMHADEKSHTLGETGMQTEKENRERFLRIAPLKVDQNLPWLHPSQGDADSTNLGGHETGMPGRRVFIYQHGLLAMGKLACFSRTVASQGPGDSGSGSIPDDVVTYPSVCDPSKTHAREAAGSGPVLDSHTGAVVALHVSNGWPGRPPNGKASQVSPPDRAPCRALSMVAIMADLHLRSHGLLLLRQWKLQPPPFMPSPLDALRVVSRLMRAPGPCGRERLLASSVTFQAAALDFLLLQLRLLFAETPRRGPAGGKQRGQGGPPQFKACLVRTLGAGEPELVQLVHRSTVWQILCPAPDTSGSGAGSEEKAMVCDVFGAISHALAIHAAHKGVLEFKYARAFRDEEIVVASPDQSNFARQFGLSQGTLEEHPGTKGRKKSRKSKNSKAVSKSRQQPSDATVANNRPPPFDRLVQSQQLRQQQMGSDTLLENAKAVLLYLAFLLPAEESALRLGQEEGEKGKEQAQVSRLALALQMRRGAQGLKGLVASMLVGMGGEAVWRSELQVARSALDRLKALETSRQDLADRVDGQWQARYTEIEGRLEKKTKSEAAAQEQLRKLSLELESAKVQAAASDILHSDKHDAMKQAEAAKTSEALSRKEKSHASEKDKLQLQLAVLQAELSGLAAKGEKDMLALGQEWKDKLKTSQGVWEDKLKRQTERANAEIDSLTRMNSKQKIQLVDAKARDSALQNELEAASESLQALRSESAANDSERETLLQQIERLRGEKTELERNSAALRGEAERAAQENQSSLQNSQTEFMKSTKAIERLQEELKASKRSGEQLVAEKNQLESNVEALQREIKEKMAAVSKIEAKVIKQEKSRKAKNAKGLNERLAQAEAALAEALKIRDAAKQMAFESQRRLEDSQKRLAARNEKLKKQLEEQHVSRESKKSKGGKKDLQAAHKTNHELRKKLENGKITRKKTMALLVDLLDARLSAGRRAGHEASLPPLSLDPAQFVKADRAVSSQDVNKVLASEIEAAQQLLVRISSENQKFAKSLSEIAANGSSSRLGKPAPDAAKDSAGEALLETREQLQRVRDELRVLRAKEQRRRTAEDAWKAEKRVADMWSEQSSVATQAASSSEVLRLTMLNRQLTTQLEALAPRPSPRSFLAPLSDSPRTSSVSSLPPSAEKSTGERRGAPRRSGSWKPPRGSKGGIKHP